ncbi:hypothetical protein L7F22_039802 [Adiantum nelumboides]|nr:hypothetical protein [Adiantum nelumboides]
MAEVSIPGAEMLAAERIPCADLPAAHWFVKPGIPRADVRSIGRVEHLFCAVMSSGLTVELQPPALFGIKMEVDLNIGLKLDKLQMTIIVFHFHCSSLMLVVPPCGKPAILNKAWFKVLVRLPSR